MPVKRQIAFRLAVLLAFRAMASPEIAVGCATANLVTLTVSVTDKDGNAVLGLQHNDFSVTEDGRKQGIAVFAFQGQDLDTTPTATGANPFRYLDHRLFTFLFDSTLMHPNELRRIQDDAIDFVRNGLRPGELLSIQTAVAGSVETIQDFTDDRTALVAAVDKLRMPGLGTANHNLNGDAALTTIAEACRDLPFAPKKSLLYFHATIDHSGANTPAALAVAANACAMWNVALYPIGVAPASLTELAAKTGGQTFSDRPSAIDESRRKSGPYYIVGYYSTNFRLDGKVRKVNLKLTRRGSQQVKLEYSHEYFVDKTLPSTLHGPAPVCF
jgi:VWFA-related protein